MGLILYHRIIPFAVLLGFGGGGLFWLLGNPELGKQLIVMGAFAGLSWGIMGIMLSRYKFILSVFWFIILGCMIARVTIWKEIQPDSTETSAFIRIIDQNWTKVIGGLLAYMALYALSWGQSIDHAPPVRRNQPIYPTFEYEKDLPQLPAIGETIGMPTTEAPLARESMMKRRERYATIRRLWNGEHELDAVKLLRPGEYIVDGEVESDND